MKRAFLPMLAALALAASACGGGAAEGVRVDQGGSLLTFSGSVPAPSPNAKDLALAGERAPQGPMGAAGPAGQTVGEADQRLIVRTVSMSLLAPEVAAAVEAVGALAEEMGGFTVSSWIGGKGAAESGSVSIRVPAERTGDAVARIRDLATRVESESTNSQDVTEEHVDLEARLANLERTETQYQRLYDRAETVEDVLKVQRELTSVQGQIEQLKGRLQYLERTAAMSLISVEVRPAASPEPLVKPGWSAGETAREAVRALTAFGQGVVDLAIKVGVFAPVWAPLAAVVGWLAWWSRRRAARKGS